MIVVGLVGVALVGAYVWGVHVGVREAGLEGYRQGLKASARLADDYAQFELADTEGRVGQRLERASIAYTLARELRERARDDRPV